MSDPIIESPAAAYAPLGLVDNPFVPAPGSNDSPHWVKLVSHAAANRLLGACIRARTLSRPAVVNLSDGIPSSYWRGAENTFLGRSVESPELGMMSLNIPLDMMRLGRIRGTIAELAELVVAVDMPKTIGAWYMRSLTSDHAELPEASLVSADQVAEAVSLFAEDPEAAIQRYLNARADAVSEAEEDMLVRSAYLRQLAEPADVAQEEEGAEASRMELGPVPDSDVAAETVEGEDAELGEEPAAEPEPDANMREYLLALARELSPIIERGLEGYAQAGASLAAQEFKATKAPRKTLSALLRFMGARWSNIVVMYDSFEMWPNLDHQTRMDVLGSLTELRYIIGESGVMVLFVIEGQAPEISELFAAGEQADWRMPEVHSLSHGDETLRTEWIQSWLDAAALSGVSAVKADGPELAPLIVAADGNLSDFATMAEAAFRDAASRAKSAIDTAAVDAGLAAGASATK